jgi:hypothetical protein
MLYNIPITYYDLIQRGQSKTISKIDMKYFGYLRVSAGNHGEDSLSLQEHPDPVASAYGALAVTGVPSRGVPRVVSGSATRLSFHTPADYSKRHGIHRRGTSRIPGDLETNVQRGSFPRRRAALRLATHRGLCSIRKTSAVGEAVFRAS